MTNLNKQKRFGRTNVDVEVLTAGDLWAQYGPTLPDNIETVHQQPSRRRRLGVCSAGALFSLMLHALLFGTMLLGTAGQPPNKPQPLSEGGRGQSPTRQRQRSGVSAVAAQRSQHHAARSAAGRIGV